MWNLLAYLFYLALLLITTVLLYGLYNIYLHPLRHFPGPRLWSAYRIPYVSNFLQGILPFQVLAIHEQYGPVVRIAPDELAFVDPAAWRDIYGLQPNRTQNAMDGMTFTPAEPGMENSFAGATDAVHAHLRRLYAPAFSTGAVERVADTTMAELSDLFIRRLQETIAETGSHVLDLHDWYNFVAFDVAGKFAFGESFHCLEDARAHFFMKTILPGIAAGSKMNQFERYGVYSALKPLIPKSAMQAQIDLMNYVKETVDARLEQQREAKAGEEDGKTDVFAYLGRSDLSTDALYQNAVIIVMAGSNTVTGTLAAATYFLCKYPEKLRRVQQEVRARFKSDADVNSKALVHEHTLPYLDAVLKETLRLVPGSGFGNPRWIRGKGGQTVAGHHVPDDIRCSVYHYAMFRYSGNFSRPNDFVPERWIKSEIPKDCWHDDHRAFEPFGVGPRACVGKAFGDVEVRMIFVKMVLHFDFALADPNALWSEKLLADPLWEKPPLMTRLTEVTK